MFKKLENAAQKDAVSKSVSISEPAKKDNNKTSTSADAKDGTKSNTTTAPGTPGKLEKEKSANNKSPGTPVFTKEAYKALGGGIADAIVDLKVSSTEQQEVALSRNGYVQLLQEQVILPGQKNNPNISSSTFGNKISIWIWRRSFGTCSGRLKPIIDMILYPTMISTDLVLAGYTCDPVPIAGQYLWCKRAQSEEEEKDAVIDLYVTTGKKKDAADPIWQPPDITGWYRVEGNFTKSFFGGIDSFVWYRPARSRSMDVQMTNPIKGAVALTEEVRQTKIIAAVRLALRHYVPVNDVKRLANLVMENNEILANAPNSTMIRSERMMDFATVYHQYASKGRLVAGKWSKLLHDAGINMKPNDVTQCFNFFDTNHNGFITIEEYTMVLALTDYELDLALERIRLKLLLPCVPKELQKQHSQKSTSSSQSFNSANLSEKANAGVIGAQSIQQHPYIGKNKIRENLTLSHVFQMINVKSDKILSLDEIMDLASKVEVFLTEEETRKIITMMDLDGDDRIEESDFIAFMRRESVCVAKKAFRIRESAAMLRRWLVRGTNEKIDANSNNAAVASKLQWKQFKVRYEKSTGQKFPGFLSSHVLQLTLANLGIRLSSLEARELALIMAPEKSGRVHLSELHAFMGRNCRSFGELIAFLQRDLFVELLDSYRAYRQSVKATGKEDLDLLNVYRKKIDEMKKVIENVYNKPGKSSNGGAVDNSHNKDIQDREDGYSRKGDDDDDDDDDDEIVARSVPIQPIVPDPQQRRKGNQEVISIMQLKQGIQELFE